ncbi:GTP-binding protein [Hydromonas duriensis]|uniref:G3E family GTPase n=1 Tax=Hydromonas duriensis TaxID=1527608 RepID=A0A4R6Y635_9BURK|nr:GTP-binding protein [Hydromonas duriensis]TDR30202.1 G3E family GTPase [Hydromonas duriensis]
MSNSLTPVALWLENQADIRFETFVPKWAQQLAQAHLSNQVCVLAHEQTAYAKAGLACQLLKGVLWVDDDMVAQLERVLSESATKNAQKVIVIMPSRASSELWVQWLLIELPHVKAQLDEVVTLMQLDKAWGDLSKGPAIEKLQIADKVLSFNNEARTAEFADCMRALNPLAIWVHNGFSTAEEVSAAVEAYSLDAPLRREPLKKEDLLAWGAEKVVYFSFSQPLQGEKLNHVLEHWRQFYGAKFTRLNAVVHVQGESRPFCVQALQYLWTSDFIDAWPEGKAPETQIWISGQDLPWHELEADLVRCIAQ